MDALWIALTLLLSLFGQGYQAPSPQPIPPAPVVDREAPGGSVSATPGHLSPDGAKLMAQMGLGFKDRFGVAPAEIQGP